MDSHVVQVGSVEWQGLRSVRPRDVDHLVHFRFRVLPEMAIGTPNQNQHTRWVGILVFVSDGTLQGLANKVEEKALAPYVHERLEPHLFHYVQQMLMRNGLPEDQHRHIVPVDAELFCTNPENVSMDEPFLVAAPKGRIGFSDHA